MHNEGLSCHHFRGERKRSLRLLELGVAVCRNSCKRFFTGTTNYFILCAQYIFGVNFVTFTKIYLAVHGTGERTNF